MFRSILQRRLILAGAVVSAVSAGVAATDVQTFLFGWLAGLVVTGVVVWLVARPLARDLRRLARSLRAGVLEELDVPHRDADSAVTEELAHVVEQVIDETSRRRSDFFHRESDLEQNSALLETVLGTMVEGVLVVDASEQVLFANRAFGTLLNIEQKSMIGRPLVEVVRVPQIHEAARSVSSSHEAVQAEFEIARQQKTVALTATALGSSRFRGVVLVFHDVSELRRLERMRREFVSNVSHELKTPLTSIQAYADTLLDGAIEDAEHNRAFLERIVQQSERLQSLIVDLLSLAKIEAREEVFDVQAVAVDEAIQSCAEGHLAVADAKGVSLEWTADSTLCVLSDPDGLRQILDNLVDNALNYTPPGGQVRIGCRRENESCVIAVEDTGIGISRDQQARIFERFYRADKARSREVGGTGLGLAIVKHLAHAFGGSVGVASELGVGSKFEVRLPLEIADRASDQSQLSHHQGQ